MADKNTTGAGVEFCSELLSPSELFAARSRSQKIPVRGQKDFTPDTSEQQRQQLQRSLDEHWELVSEERVERQGNLVKAVWIPSDQVVELQSPAAKFWHTMGFSADGKQCLQPEEALYLMECGSLQVFYQDLPLSIQEGYERFLSSKTVTLQQYQVFGHLKRLGYVVNRFDPSSEPSPYERQLNLPQSRDRGARQLKRKRSNSPLTKGHAEAHGEEEDEPDDGGEEDKEKCPDSDPDLAAGGTSEVQTYDTAGASSQAGQSRSWWGQDVPADPDPEPGRSRPASSSTSRRWDFRSILFPDLGSRRNPPGSLAPPDPSLLPGALCVSACDVAPWLRRLNLREVKMSSRERQRERDRDRHHWDINRDKEVRRCRNWAEYQELLERRRRRRRDDRPAHLWEGTVTPLHNPRHYTSTGELLDKLSVVASSRLPDGASRLKGSDEWRICFSVYQPDTVSDFKKSQPGKPYSRMCVCSFSGPVPDLQTVKQLAFQSGDVPVTFAVVDHGDISFYTFKDFELPTDVSL